MDWLTPAYWHWWTAGAVMLIAEVFAPGVIFLWLAIGAFVAGTLLLVFPDMPWSLELLAFAIASALSLFLGRPILKRYTKEPEDGTLNERGRSLEGTVATLVEPIVNGTGRVRLGDTSWSVAGPDLPAGARVVVVGVDGARLRVAPRA
jgi:membrane protein implicated in regulation of membrane protease activity